MSLKKIFSITSVLFILSLLVYNNENKRGTDLLEGSDYIKGLDISKIYKISIISNEDKNISLTRDNNKFIIENHYSYPASNDKINDLIYKIASIQVKSKIKSKIEDKDLEFYELDEKKRKFLVQVYDKTGTKSISFTVGRSEKGKGSYLIKEGANEIYLSKNTFWINSNYKDYMDLELLKLKESDIEKIKIKSENRPYEIIKDKDEFILSSVPKEKVKKDKIINYTKNLMSMRFEDVIPLKTINSSNIKFENEIEIELKNKSKYKLSLSKKEETYYAKVLVDYEDIPKQFVLNKSDSKEDLQKIEEIIKTQQEVQKFNLDKSIWAYKINKNLYEKLVKDINFKI